MIFTRIHTFHLNFVTRTQFSVMTQTFSEAVCEMTTITNTFALCHVYGARVLSYSHLQSPSASKLSLLCLSSILDVEMEVFSSVLSSAGLPRWNRLCTVAVGGTVEAESAFPQCQILCQLFISATFCSLTFQTS